VLQAVTSAKGLSLSSPTYFVRRKEKRLAAACFDFGQRGVSPYAEDDSRNTSLHFHFFAATSTFNVPVYN